MKQSLCVVILFVEGLVANVAHGAATAEQKCQAERSKATGTYASCQQKAQAMWQTNGSDFAKLQNAASRCRVKYNATWAKLQKKATLAGSSCTAARFVDNADGTVTDNLTALVWEQKTGLDSVESLTDPHDADNFYSSCSSDVSGACSSPADGTAFTDFLRSLNSGGCFAGQCDWRLPTRDELQTILADPYTGNSCTTPSCIDATFGPTGENVYRSSTPVAGAPDRLWYVFFGDGGVFDESSVPGTRVRAVRGGGS